MLLSYTFSSGRAVVLHFEMRTAMWMRRVGQPCTTSRYASCRGGNSTAFLNYDSTCGFKYTEKKESVVILHAAAVVIVDIDLYCFIHLA